jgi:NTP pyrophosphatase (non-canonical NTP hydrolase)
MSSIDIKSLTERLTKFRDERDWQQFHSLKDLIISLNLEAGEVLELTQWKSAEQFDAMMGEAAAKSRLKEECADVLAYLLLICEKADIDILQATSDKIDQNEKKYPVEKARGTAKKYTQL